MTHLPVPIQQIKRFANLNIHEERILKAGEASPKNNFIGSLNEDALYDFAKELMNHAQAKLSSRDRLPHEIKATHKVIMEDLASEFSHFTVTEVFMAMNCGLNGDYLGKDELSPRFSPSFLVIWIRAWYELVKSPLMTKVANAIQREETKSNPMLLDISLRDRLNDHFGILYNALKLVSAGGTFYDGGNIVWDLLWRVNESFMPLALDDNHKKELVTVKLREVVESGPDKCAEFLEEVRQGILEHLKN